MERWGRGGGGVWGCGDGDGEGAKRRILGGKRGFQGGFFV